MQLDELMASVHYDPDTGVFTRLKRGGRRAVSGSKAGCINKSGYSVFMINKKLYYAHRLAWLYVYGVWPDHIDHINHIASDNRIINLRSVPAAINMKNQPARKKGNKDCGVYKNEAGKWCARIKANYKEIALGTFETREMAVAARKRADQQYGFHENHGASL